MRANAIFIPILLVMFVAPLWSQDSAAISGRVQDSTGAVLPGVNIKLTNKAQGIVREQVSNEAGVYQFTFLPTGAYDIEVSLQGFKTLKRTDVTMAVAQN